MKKTILILTFVILNGLLIRSFAQCPNPVQCSSGQYGDIVNVKLGGYGGTQTFTTFDYTNDKITLYRNVFANSNLYITGGLHVGGTSSPGTDNMIVDGNLGIGTGTPSYKLDVNGTLRVNSLSNPGRDYRIVCNGRQEIYASNDLVTYVNGNSEIRVGVTGSNKSFYITDGVGSKKFCVREDGYVGIGTTNPQSELHLYNSTSWHPTLTIEGGTATGGMGGIDLLNDAKNGWQFNVMGSNRTPGYGIPNTLEIGQIANGNYVGTSMSISPGGHVGIGTDSPSTTAMLSVDGKIEAEEIEVKNIGADYVFEDEYELRSLIELENYIKENKHLPGIASASETEEGTNLGEFSNVLLEKIEEFTLYLIELKKENAELQTQIESLIK